MSYVGARSDGCLNWIRMSADSLSMGEMADVHVCVGVLCSIALCDGG